MECQDCGTEMRVKRTYPSGTDKAPTTTRVQECPCGSRFLSEEAITRRLPAISSPPVARRRASGTPPNGVRQAADGSETARPCDSSIPNGGKKGGDPASRSDSGFVSQSALSDPDPSVETPQRVDRAKQARPDPFSAHFGGSGGAFGKVYAAYPNKVGRSAASTVFAELASAHPHGADGLAAAVLGAFETGMLGRYPYVINGEGKWPALEKFLVNRRWEDEPNAEQKQESSADARVGAGRAMKHTVTGEQAI